MLLGLPLGVDEMIPCWDKIQAYDLLSVAFLDFVDFEVFPDLFQPDTRPRFTVLNGND
jgi:hypothetical protein